MEILFGKKRLVVGPRDSSGTEGIVVCYSLGMAAFSVSQEKVSDFCRRNHIKRLAFFGSVLRDDFRPDSDLDVIVEFEPGHVPGLRYFAMERELSEILGRKVDLNTPGTLSKYFRDRVLAEAEPQYVAP
jgi:predicted nucleotidyltransferase